MKKIISLMSIALGIFFKTSLALAGTGYCTPKNGTESLEYSWGTYTITDPSQNTPGTTAPEKEVDAPSGGITLNCSCDSGPYANAWIWGDTTLSGETTVGDYNYYDIPGNDYLQVGMKIYSLGDMVWHSVPFGPVTNYTDSETSYKCNTDFDIATGGTSTGSRAKISLRIKKSFVGTSMISPVIISSIYWTLGGATTHGPVPATNLYISGTVTVPQSCTINDGAIVTVDFGQLYAGEFLNKGQKAGLQPDKTITVPIKCNNINAGANMTMRFQAEPSADYSDAIKSTNPDVGVVVKDDQGNVITPNEGLIPFTLDDNLDANVTFHLEPVSTTGVEPSAGTFQAQAYIRVDFA